MTDVYCDLSDIKGESLRAPDVCLVSGLSKPKDDFFRGTPLIAVEIRATQAKRHLEEKVQLYVEHAWPCTWIVHAERGEVEVVRPGLAKVTYRPGASVPLGPDLSKYELSAVPVTALFDELEFARYSDDWVHDHAEAQAQGRVTGRRAGLDHQPGRSIIRCHKGGASIVVPVVGSTALQTAGLVAAAGPGGSTQQQVTVNVSAPAPQPPTIGGGASTPFTCRKNGFLLFHPSIAIQ